MPKPDPMTWKLEQWSQGFYSVYAIKDDKKTYSEIWLSATSHASSVAEDARLNDYENIVLHLTNVFAWLLSFAQRFTIDVAQSPVATGFANEHGANWTEWILHKYPRVCNTCGMSPCICPSYRDIMELRRGDKKADYEKFLLTREGPIQKAFDETFRQKKLHTAITMPGLFDMFHDIYGGPLWGSSLSDITFHFVEEIGEVSKEITHLEGTCDPHSRNSWNDYVKQHYKETGIWDKYSIVCTLLSRELADVFSWTTAMLYKVKQLQKSEWEPREVLVKLYTSKVGRQSVSIGEDDFHFFCRYCSKLPCREDCIPNQLEKRVEEGKEESQKKFKYEIPAA
jgi:NTP pyrophosphatase (non-canonical NTP hydrolase)